MTTTQEARRRVGIVGVGAMGRPMVARMIAAGFTVVFHARRPEVVNDVTSIGAQAVADVAAVGAASDLVIVCVFSDEQVREVCLGETGLIETMKPGSILVNHTTGSPYTAIRLAVLGAARGIRFLDAALSGGPQTIEAGRLTLLIGGDHEVLEAARPVLASYADPILPVGVVGNGQRVKLINNALFAAQITLAGEAERLATQLGVPPATALAAITHCSGASFSLGTVVATGSAAATRERVGPFIRKDVAMVRAVAKELEVDLGVLGELAEREL